MAGGEHVLPWVLRDRLRVTDAALAATASRQTAHE